MRSLPCSHTRFGDGPQAVSGPSKASGTATGYWPSPITARCGCGRAGGRDVTRISAIALSWQPISPTITRYSMARSSFLTSPVSSFNEMQNASRATRVEYRVFDLLYLDGRSLLRASIRIGESCWRRWPVDHLAVPTVPGDGANALEQSRKARLEGVVAKGVTPVTSGPALRVVDQGQHWNTQEVVIGGCGPASGRRQWHRSLLMAYRRPGLHFAGR